VPASDQRDFEFARKYDLPIIPVVDPPPPAEPLDAGSLTEAYVEPGIMRSSGQFDGMPNEEAKSAITAWLEAQGRGKHAVSWRLRDWCLSRQRYWGTPIPIIYCDSCGTVPVPAEDLPVRLPEDVQFTGKGESPLATHESFVRTICPTCGAAARRETDTMDTFVNSAWYFLRYTCASYTEGPIDRAASDRWMPVDQYIGGIEHATGHLIYSRFFHKLLRDLGYTAPDEPFVRLLTQGMVCKETRKCPVHGWIYPEEEEPSGAEDVPGTHRDCGERVEIGPSVKMSKSLKNVIDPEALIERYGADTARMFVLFASPPTKGLEWSDEGVEGIWRFLGRVWRLFEAHGAALVGVSPYAGDGSDLSGADKALRRKLHKTIDKVTSDIEDRLQFNTAIAAQMELLNLLMGRLEGADENPTPAVMRETIDALAHMLNPFAPHLAEELWASVGGERSLMEESWPEVDRAAAADDDVLYVVQVDGKTRGRITVDAGTGKEAILALAKESGSVPGHLDGRDMLREILVPKRLVNFVTRPKA
jgi:leucyl-tRNA synthetase